MSRRLSHVCVRLYDALALLAVAAVLSFAFTAPAYAYVDPSVMTYAIQAIAGVAVALSTVLGVAFRRTRKKLLRAMGIDENARKQREPRVHRVDENGQVVLTAADEAAAEKGAARSGSRAGRASQPTGYAPSWPVRLGIGVAVSAFAVFTVLVVAPCEIVAGNEDSLLFGLSSTWSIFLVPGVLIAAVLGFVLSALRGRVFNAVALLVFGAGLACYVQVLFFNGGLPTATGATVDWTQYKTIMVVSTGVWVVLTVLPWMLSQLNRKVVQLASLFLSVALVFVQCVGLGSLLVGGSDDEGDAVDYIVTKTGMCNVTEDNNIVVFVLDGCDTKTDLMPALEQDPDLLSEFTGFTWYQDSAAVATPTRDALPALLTGKYDAPNSDSATDSKAQNADYLRDLDEAGYDVGLYTDMIPGSTPGFYEHTINGLDDKSDYAASVKPDVEGTLTAFWKCALYRDLPWAFKPFFWFYTDEINAAMKSSDATDEVMVTDRGYQVDTTPYTIDDIDFYEQLSGEGLSVVSNSSTGSFKLIHLNGPHYPYIMGEDSRPSDSSDRLIQTRGSFNIASEYLRQMKELGVYDDATIIVTADHGYRSESNFDLIDGELAMSPILLIKPAGDHQQALAPLEVSQVPVCSTDVMTTALDGAPGIDASNYPTSIFDMTDDQRVRYFYFLIKDETLTERGWMEIRIDGDVLDAQNWEPTGVVFDREIWDWRQVEDSQEFSEEWLKYLFKNVW